MPAKSKAQQAYMAIAEHSPTALYGPKPDMTHEQLHDFAATPRAGLPAHAKKPLHPKMRERAQLVKAAHAHLGKTVPGFHQLPGREKMTAVQRHVTTRLKRGR